MYYFNYYAHQSPQKEEPARPRHELHTLDKVAFMQRWHDYHQRTRRFGELLKPPLLTLPSTSLGLPPTEKELAALGLPLHYATLMILDQPTEERIQPPTAETFHCNLPRPPKITPETWETWLPVVEDHLLYSETRWELKMTDFIDDPDTYAIVENIRLYIVRHWAQRSQRKLLSYSKLVSYSQRYGYNIQAMLNWLIDDIKITCIPRIDLSNFNAPESDIERYIGSMPKALEGGNRWWSPENSLKIREMEKVENNDEY